MEDVELISVKHTTVGIHLDTPLNINLNINENQDYKIGTVGGH
jgi:hypothetical protein